jgi:hypothetical protein
MFQVCTRFQSNLRGNKLALIDGRNTCKKRNFAQVAVKCWQKLLLDGVKGKSSSRIRLPLVESLDLSVIINLEFHVAICKIPSYAQALFH